MILLVGRQYIMICAKVFKYKLLEILIMRKLSKVLFFVASFMMFCLFFNCESVLAGTKTTCTKAGNDASNCNICLGTDYKLDTNNCPHIAGQVYDNIVYYFYASDQRRYIDIDREKIEQWLEVENENIVFVYIDSAATFRTKWNEMGKIGNEYYYIRAVIIHMHGAAGVNKIGDATAINGGAGACITESDINGLYTKRVDRLALLTCYGAYQYFANNNNVAKLFSNKIRGGDVIAGSAQVYPHEARGNNNLAYIVYYVAIKEAADKNGVFTPSDTYNDGYNWIIYKDGQYVKVCSRDCYNILALLEMGRSYEEEE